MEKNSGLTTADARIKLQKYGLNELPQAPPTSDLKVLIHQIQSPLIYILFAAAGVSLILKDTIDALVIFLAVVVNTSLGFFQERKAERSLNSLKQILSPKTKVIRDGQQIEIEVKFLVPGDLVVVTGGDKIPADGILMQAESLFVNEAILTGESEAIKKIYDLRFKNKELGLTANYELSSANSQLVFMGTTVVSGIGKFIVTKTGTESEFGKIAVSLSKTADEPTPLQIQLEKLARFISILVVIVAGFVFLAGIFLGQNLHEMFLTSVAIAVAAIPEGMVVALTAILAIGMQRLHKRKALVRTLVAAETLGSVTVIATDKTGTLTAGKLKVVKILSEDIKRLKEIAVLTNHLLDPLEIAMWEWSQSGGFDPQESKDATQIKQIIPFDVEAKISACVTETGMFVLGAPEILLQRCAVNQEDSQKIKETITAWGKQGLRMVAGAYRTANIKYKKTKIKIEEINNLEWVGLIGFTDPIREGVKNALKNCTDAGIKVKVITGDHRYTAEAVLRELGINLHHPESQVLEGHEIENLSIKDLKLRVDAVVLFARVTPSQKLKIVEALKQNGEVVALVGDGVNDAPALKKADIGIVVADASDTARETADMVLLDSNFATIVAAVEEGRGIFINIKKVVLYLLSNSFAEVILVVGALILGLPLPITAAQILWINIVSDGTPSLALNFEPKEKGLLKRKPISSTISLISSRMKSLMVSVSLLIGFLSLFAFQYSLKVSHDINFARSITFTTLGLTSLFYIFVVRNYRGHIFSDHPFRNIYVIFSVILGTILQIIAVNTSLFQKILGTRSVSLTWWGVIFVLVVVELVLIELLKGILRRRGSFRL